MMMKTIETTSEKYYNEAIRQLLQNPMIIVCIVQMFSGFMDDFFRVVRGCSNGCKNNYDNSNIFKICTQKRLQREN
jgi:hypothetical protein